MVHLRQIALECILQDLDDETQKLYKLAEIICRKEYEKFMKCDLDLPLGHPKNLIPCSRKVILDIIGFWEDTKNKYFDKCRDPLASAIAYFCDIHAAGMITLLRKLTE